MIVRLKSIEQQQKKHFHDKNMNETRESEYDLTQIIKEF